MARRIRAIKAQQVESYSHPQSKSPMRPDVGTQSLFKKKKPPQKYVYDSSLSPALEWDGQNPAREQGEAAIEEISREVARISAKLAEQLIQLNESSSAAESLAKIEAAVEKLKRLGRPFLNWAGKAEHLSFDVPTLPLFVHERLSTEDIIETLKGHQRNKQQVLGGFYADPQHSVANQLMRAYDYQDRWSNRMILGDSLVVMNSLLHYENMGGQVQMIYVDPPYGVKFGSNFQPFVRRRDVKHNDDEQMTREPEMVQAYRDTWELGVHSYLTYLRDRLTLSRDLLTESGSIFVQISDENLHHVREVMDEVFGADNFCALIPFVKTSGMSDNLLSSVADFLLWYAKDRNAVKYRQLFRPKSLGDEGTSQYTWVESPDKGIIRPLTAQEIDKPDSIPKGWRVFSRGDLRSQGAPTESQSPFIWNGKEFRLPANSHWKTTLEGLNRLAAEDRLVLVGNTLMYKRYLNDFPVYPINNIWRDTVITSFSDEKLYVVQSSSKVPERCLLMTTDPGDLVLDPTSGSGTTAYVAEQWGRRWLTIDTSRVPLALTRQRLLTATFPFYELKDESLGPAGGFVYKRKQTKKGEEVGGIVPHITLKSIANNEPPTEEVLVDRPEVVKGVTRVTGTFAFDATIPTPVDLDGDGQEDSGANAALTYGTFVERMLEVLRRSPVLRLNGNRTVTFKNIRPPAKSLSLSAVALVDATAPGQTTTIEEDAAESIEQNGGALPFSEKPVAFVFGPENGAVSENLVFQAAREALAKNYTHLYVIGFAIQPNARELIENCAESVGVPATYVQATPDLMMSDLLKNMRSSHIFSVAGLPEIAIHKQQTKEGKKYQVELLGLDVFDPVTMKVDHRKGNDVPAWLLDTDYNGLCFLVSQAFFPRTSAWDNLKKALRGEYDEEVWHHLAGTTSAPFEAGEHNQIAVKVIDDRGNELLVVKRLQEAGR